MKYNLLITILIILGFSGGANNKSVSQIDSLIYNLEVNNQNYECNIEKVKLANQSISKLTEDILLGFLFTFSEKCKNNSEFREFSNETLLEIIFLKTELLISTIHKHNDQLNLRLIRNEIENPINDKFYISDYYEKVKEVFGYNSTKDSILQSIEVSMDKANILYFKIDDCNFDQSTQNDEFLRNIPELKNYVWNKHISSAKIQLSQDETLYLSRGGCNHFEVSAKFKIKGNEINLDEALEKILWIANLLGEEFETELLKEAIEKKEYDMGNPNYMSFSNQHLSDLSYSMSFIQNNEVTYIFLSWSMN